MASLKQKSINGMIWTLGDRFSLQFVTLLVSIILARLLQPAEFGLIGMLAIFTAVAQSIMDSGFGSALIQKKHATIVDTSSIFYFNLVIGIILAGLLSLAAPWIANFYQQPQLVSLTRVLSLNLVINAFSLVQTSLLTKRMNFKAQFKVHFIAAIVSGAVGILMAYLGFGVWSIATQMVLNNLFSAILYWIFNKWRPKAVFSFAALKTMFSYGSRLMISHLLTTLHQNIYEAFIGKQFSASELGYFNRAISYERSASQTFSSTLGKVTFPALSPLQDDDRTLKQAYRKTIKLSVFLHFPLMIGLMAVADPLIRILLTDRWAPSIPMFQLLCVVGLWHPLHNLNLNLLKVKGRSDIYLRLGVIKKLSVIPAIAITYRWGILALIYGKIATSVFAYFINSYYSGHLIGYPEIEQIKDFLPSLLKSILMGSIMFVSGMFINQNHIIKLATQVVIGIFMYWLINTITKSSELKEIIDISLDTLKAFLRQLKRKNE